MMEIISLLLAILKAVPIIDKWVQVFIVEYHNKSVDKMKKENLDAIRKAINEHDQRELEKAIGNPTPGEPSGTPGADIVDKLPGVRNKP